MEKPQNQQRHPKASAFCYNLISLIYYCYHVTVTSSSYVVSTTSVRPSTSFVVGPSSTSGLYKGQRGVTTLRQTMECARRCADHSLYGCSGFAVETNTNGTIFHDCQLNVTSHNSMVSSDEVIYDRGPRCPAMNDFWQVGVNGNTFCLAIMEGSAHEVDFWDAVTRCLVMGHGATLVRMDHLDKYDAIMRVKEETGVGFLKFWIDASDTAQEGQWVHATNGEPVNEDLMLWAQTALVNSSSDQDCATIHGGRRKSISLKDRRCTQLHGFICEAPTL